MIRDVRAGRLVAVVAAAAVFVGCADGDAAGSDASATGPEVVDDGIRVSEAWTRATPPGASEAVFYLAVENLAAPDDRLLGGRSDRCLTVHPHLTEIDEADVSRMSRAGPEMLALPADGRLDFVPNGLHLMCVGLASPVEAGETIELELVFERHATIAVTAVARPFS